MKEKKKVKKAIIPAAGLGTRFLPFTKSVPKEMLPIVDKPTIQYIIEEIVDSGIDEILIINGRNKVVMVNHFDDVPELEFMLEKAGKTEELKMVKDITNLANIFVIRQKEAKGLGHAVLCAKEFVDDEPFAVVLGDEIVYNPEKPALKQLLDVYDETGSSVIGVKEVPDSDIDKYGIVTFKDEDNEDEVKEISSLVEKPEIGSVKSNQAIVGRYVINPEIFDILEETEPGINGEIQLTDALIKLLDDQKIYSCTFEGQRYDLGNKLGFLEATVEHGLRNKELSKDFRKYLKDLIKTLEDEDSAYEYFNDPTNEVIHKNN